MVAESGCSLSRALSHPDDPAYLPPHLCLIRSHIEAFVIAGDGDFADPSYRRVEGGTFGAGRVGLRCVHCAGGGGVGGAALVSRNNSVLYPKSIRTVYQSFRNWMRYHLPWCPSFPSDVRARYLEMKAAPGAGRSKKDAPWHWEECCRGMGMIDTPGGISLRTGRFLDDGVVGAGNGSSVVMAERVRGAGVPVCGKGKGLVDERASAKPPSREGHANQVSAAEHGPAGVGEAVPDRIGTQTEAQNASVASTTRTVVSDGLSPLRPQDDKMVCVPLPIQMGEADTVKADVTYSTKGNREEPSPQRDKQRNDSKVSSDRQRNQLSPSIEHVENAQVAIAELTLLSNPNAMFQGQRINHEPQISAETIGESCDIINQAPTLSRGPQNVSLDTDQDATFDPLMLERPMSNDMSLREKVQLAITAVQTAGGIHLISDEEGAPTQECMHGLGEQLYEFFSGQVFHRSSSTIDNAADGSPHNRHYEEEIPDLQQRSKRGKTQGKATPYVPLSELGFPAALCGLVSSLLDHDCDSSGQTNDYESFAQVEEDLEFMASKPDTYLLSDDTCDGNIRINRHALHGREGEIAALIGAYDRATSTNASSGDSCVAIVTGYSGTGKSSLVEAAKHQFVERGACFVSGKFDAMMQVQPLSAIVSALGDYCNLLASDEARSEMWKEAVESAMGNEGMILANLIPNIDKLLPARASSPPILVSGRDVIHRLVRRLLRATCSRAHPVVLFLDDLQWADEMSLELVKHLAIDSTIEGLLFVGSYRDNEVGEEHPLVEALNVINSTGDTDVVSVHVGKLDNKNLNLLVSEILRLAPQTTRSLTTAIERKTGGNAFYALQFLVALCDEGLLHFSPSSRRWLWDIEQIRKKDVADGVVELMVAKLLMLSREVQEVLSVSSAFGAVCQESILRILERAPDSDIIPCYVTALDFAVCEGLLNKTESAIAGSSFRFSHDQIQRAAYLLIPESEREAFHLKIGRQLLNGAREEEVVTHLFIIVDQMHRGCNLITNWDERINLMQLSLAAGKAASEKYAFLPASTYFKAGIEKLKVNSDWEQRRDLCLELYNSCIEAEYVVGDFDGMQEHINQVFRRANNLEEKLRAHYTLLQFMGTQGRSADLVRAATDILSQLGEPMPVEVTSTVVMQEIMLTKQVLHSKEEDILTVESMVDTKKQAAMKCLLMLVVYTYIGNKEMFIVAVCRMVRLSLTYGLCPSSALGFAAYGITLCGFLNDFEQGYRLGKVALYILDKFETKENLPGVYLCVYGFINHFVEPIQSSFPFLKRAVNVGLACGDKDFAMVAAQTCSSSALVSGEKLCPLLEEIEQYSKQALECNNQYVSEKIDAVRQSAMKLLGKSADPVQLHGGSIFVGLNGVGCHTLWWRFQLWIQYLFGQYESAWRTRSENPDPSTMVVGSFNIACHYTFYSGLVALALAHKEKKNEYFDTIHESINQLEQWSKTSPWNCQHRLELLRAECAYLNGDINGAVKAFDSAIDMAAKHHFVHEEALAFERAGIFYLDCGDHNRSSHCFRKALCCYDTWEAYAKASHFERKYL